MIVPLGPECEFYIPIRRDKLLSDGELQSTKAWRWLDNELFARFGARTRYPNLCHGFYPDPDTGERVDDLSRKFSVALADEKLDELRELLRLACAVFHQKCIYLSVAGRAELIFL